MSVKRPLFENFHYRRLVVDEGHEILEDDSYPSSPFLSFFPFLLSFSFSFSSPSVSLFLLFSFVFYFILLILA